ncbi:hypothetical protein JOB18_022336 [Solea senegalensis]|uniref:Uncharacterized protein n=1 Tax=Solea senegalensis TaxID=28829 RepID=A0AAV6SF07_SOLSE|nr:hypothetical protein JOB18_022336 [Solea senegalensis]
METLTRFKHFTPHDLFAVCLLGRRTTGEELNTRVSSGMSADAGTDVAAMSKDLNASSPLPVFWILPLTLVTLPSVGVDRSIVPSFSNSSIDYIKHVPSSFHVNVNLDRRREEGDRSLLLVLFFR